MQNGGCGCFDFETVGRHERTWLPEMGRKQARPDQEFQRFEVILFLFFIPFCLFYFCTDRGGNHNGPAHNFQPAQPLEFLLGFFFHSYFHHNLAASYRHW